MTDNQLYCPGCDHSLIEEFRPRCSHTHKPTTLTVEQIEISMARTAEYNALTEQSWLAPVGDENDS